MRDGKWSEEDAAVLVPGDVVSIKLGDIIPADARLLEGDPLKIDQVLSFPSNIIKQLEWTYYVPKLKKFWDQFIPCLSVSS